MRINTVKSARNDQGNCIRCNNPIGKGEPYQWFRPFRGVKRSKHLGCAPFKPSELTGNPHLSTAYRVQEDLEENGLLCTDPIVMAEMLEAGASDLQDAVDGFREASENLEEGFSHPTTQSEELAEKADELETWMDRLGEVAEEIRGMVDEERTPSESEIEEINSLYDEVVQEMPL